jgi:hypothetical protein
VADPAEIETVPLATAYARLDPKAAASLSGWLDQLLSNQLARVRRRFFVHGLATTLLLPAAVVLAAFLLDHFLRLPLPIRVFHTVLAIAACAVATWRFLWYPISRQFVATDVAVLLERAFPELHERLVSAVQLKDAMQNGTDGVLRNQSSAMIEQLLADTAAATQRLPLEQLFVPTRTRQLWSGAVALLLLLAGGAVAMPDTASAFFWRHIGFDVSYPRATSLVVELPPASPDLQREDRDRETALVVPAGADLQVSVLANGVVPTEVFLEVLGQGGVQRSIATAPRPGSRFRYVFRRVTTSFEFFARGGDDDAGDRRVTVRTIHPPLVAQVKAELRAPAYTRKAVEVQTGGAIETLIGTSVQVSVQATTGVTSAALVFLESGKRVPLVPRALTDDSGTITLLVGDFTVEQSDRYQVELIGDGGLRNPNPGTYPVTALQDYAPVGRWLQPDDEANTPLLPEGILCIRGEARDDFGLLQGSLQIDAGNDRTTQRALVAPLADGEPPLLQLLFLDLIELRELLPAQASTDGLSLQLELTDNRAPIANSTQLPRRQVQIVDLAQLSAAIARHFRSLREDVEQALDLQTDRRARLADLIAAQPSQNAATAQELTAIEVGQGRVQSAADRMLRGAMRAFDMHLWNRLDPSPNAPAVVEFYRAWHQQNGLAISYQPAFYRELAQLRQQGTIGSLDQSLDPILRMVLLTDQLSEQLSPPLLRTLAEAQVAANSADLQQSLQRAIALQDKVLATLQDLLSRLDEWNDYQDLVQEARSLIEKQRDLQHRTEQTRGRK